MVNISKPWTLSPTIVVDNTVISEFDPVGRIFETTRENSADGHTQNTNRQNVMKRRVGRNGRANSMTINTLIDHREVDDEIKQVKRLSFLPAIEVDNANYFNKIDTDDETQKALRSHGKLKEDALPVVNDEQFPVEKQKGLNMAFEQIECEKHLITLQQNSRGYIGDEEDYHDQTKSKLNPFVSSHTATRNDDDRQQPNTYVAGEKYNKSHVLSEQF